jgi:hypothetical protein
LLYFIDHHICKKCLDPFYSRISYFFVVFLFLFVMMMIILTFIENFATLHYEKSIPIIRMLITFLQYFTILSKLETFGGSNEVDFYLSIIDFRSTFMQPAEILFDLQCTRLVELSKETKYYMLLVFQTLLPVIIFVFSLLLWGLFFCFKGQRQDRE